MCIFLPYLLYIELVDIPQGSNSSSDAENCFLVDENQSNAGLLVVDDDPSAKRCQSSAESSDAEEDESSLPDENQSHSADLETSGEQIDL